jgi:hypothetical protein
LEASREKIGRKKFWGPVWIFEGIPRLMFHYETNPAFFQTHFSDELEFDKKARYIMAQS